MKDNKAKKHTYLTIYIPNQIYDDKDKTEIALEDIDCNFSRIIGILLRPLISICNIITAVGKNYRHFQWYFLVRDRATGNWYCSRNDIQVRQVKQKPNP